MASIIKTIFNIIWWLSLGLIDAALYYIVGFLMNLTVIMKPLGDGFIEIAKFNVAPFTRSLIRKDDLGNKHKYIWNTTSKTLFYLYLPIGIALFLMYAYFLYLRVISIFFIFGAIPIIKLLPFLLNPIGIICVSDEVKVHVSKKAAKREIRAQEKSLGALSSSYSSNASSAYSSRTPSPAPVKHDKKKEHHKSHH